MARLDKIDDIAKHFVLLRLENMRGVNLDLFDFDYDLTWWAMFVSGEGKVYGRFGGRDAESSEARLSLAGLRFALEEALKVHRETMNQKAIEPKSNRTAEQLSAARRLKDNACIHCHHVYDFRREELQLTGKWRLDDVWVYPVPENIGLTLDVDRGNRVLKAQADSAADRAGIKTGDTLMTVNEVRIASLADVQYALQRAPATGLVSLTWQHDGETRQGRLELAPGWRKTDVSWRWSLRGLEPLPPVHGDDLSAAEKKTLGLAEKSLAFRQGNFLSMASRQAGLQQNDIIVGVEGKSFQMTARQFGAYLRLNFKVGDTVTFQVIRAGQRFDLPIKLAGKAPF